MSHSTHLRNLSGILIVLSRPTLFRFEQPEVALDSFVLDLAVLFVSLAYEGGIKVPRQVDVILIVFRKGFEALANVMVGVEPSYVAEYLRRYSRYSLNWASSLNWITLLIRRWSKISLTSF